MRRYKALCVATAVAPTLLMPLPRPRALEVFHTMAAQALPRASPEERAALGPWVFRNFAETVLLPGAHPRVKAPMPVSDLGLPGDGGRAEWKAASYRRRGWGEGAGVSVVFTNLSTSEIRELTMI